MLLWSGRWAPPCNETLRQVAVVEALPKAPAWQHQCFVWLASEAPVRLIMPQLTTTSATQQHPEQDLAPAACTLLHVTSLTYGPDRV